jgi:hypothetical protein
MNRIIFQLPHHDPIDIIPTDTGNDLLPAGAPSNVEGHGRRLVKARISTDWRRSS